MRSSQAAFSLLETLVAVAVIAGMGAVAFRLFHQNERLFRDQSLILEMQQGARVLVSQISDDVRKAGQGVPPALGEIVLPGSTASRLNLRASLNAVESAVVSSLPFSVMTGTDLTLFVESTPGFSAGRQAFLWSDLVWARATIDFVSGSAHSVRLTPTQASQAPLDFVVPPTLSLDEAVSVFWDGAARAVRRTTATSTEDPANPSWVPANELVAHVASLNFTYLNAGGAPVTPDSPAGRSEVRAIEVRVMVRTSAPLSDATRPTYGLSTRVLVRNARGQ